MPIDSTGLKTSTITFLVSFPSVPRVIANLANFDNDAIYIKGNVLDPPSATVGDNADIIWYATVASQSGDRE